MLKAAGFEEKRCKGDHHFFKHPDGRATTVPYARKKDLIAPRTYKQILHQTSLGGKR